MSEPSKLRFRKKQLGSYPYISVVFSITLALFAIGVFGTLVIYSKELESIVRDNVKIQVYLKNQLTAKQLSAIQKQLQGKYLLPKQILQNQFSSSPKKKQLNSSLKKQARISKNSWVKIHCAMHTS